MDWMDVHVHAGRGMGMGMGMVMVAAEATQPERRDKDTLRSGEPNCGGHLDRPD